MTDSARTRAMTDGVVTVIKRDWRGEPVGSWQGEVWARAEGYVVLRAIFNRPRAVPVAEDITFEPGDVFYEHYADGKPYGLWQVLTPDERTLKCWYCNISTPAEMTADGDTITFRDLLLDVLVRPDGSYQVLDRDDLIRAQAEGLDAGLATAAEEGTRAVLDLLQRGEPPLRMRVGP